MRIIFAGTPSTALPSLEALVGSNHDVVGVITRPPARLGRSKKLVDSPVAAWAKSRGLDVLETSQPNTGEALDWINDKDAELGVVVAYGALLRTQVLESLPKGWINLHFSRLPRLRGAAPVQRAILAGDTTIGTTVFLLDEGMDTGPVLSVQDHELSNNWTSGDALEYLAVVGAKQLVQTTDSIGEGTAQLTPQTIGDEGQNISFAPKLERNDGFIGFADSSFLVAARTRAVTPSPGAWTTLDGQVIKLGPVNTLEPPSSDGDAGLPSSLDVGQIYAEKKRVLVGCKNGVVALTRVAPAGKSWMEAADWARGARFAPGQKLGVSNES